MKNQTNKPINERWYKRPFDITLALLGLVFFSPLFILFSFLIWREDKGHIFYRQVRMGKGAKEFQILKFRSMSVASEEIPTCNIKKEGSQISVTKIGKSLRQTAMDEIPQLVNILKGEMSFVGPRPIMPFEARTLDPSVFSMRSTVRPGLTGLAQICADKYIPNNEKLQYDLRYINNQTLWLDIKIIFSSVIVTLKRKWETEWEVTIKK